MSGECDKCGNHTLECACKPLSRRREYGRLNVNVVPLCNDNLDPPAENLPQPKWIGVDSREEHQAIISDPVKCRELGLDQHYEIIVYLKRWGSWLGH